MTDNVLNADDWSFKPALQSVAIVYVLNFLCQLPGTFNLFLLPLTLLGYAAVAISILVVAGIGFFKKRPKDSASTLLVLLLPVLLWRPINWVADVVHLGLTTGFGAGQLGDPVTSSDCRFAAYNWSIGLVTNPRTFLIHDSTNEIALPIAQHKEPLSLEQGFAEECAGKVDHVIGHYYICNF